MGQAKQRKLAGEYPALTTKADETAFVRDLSANAENNSNVDSWLSGYDVALTASERAEVELSVYNSQPVFLVRVRQC